MDRAGTNREAVYTYIRRHMALYGAPPTVREIGRACGISSTSVVMRHLDRLRRDGCIEPRPARRRGQATARNVRLSDARTVFVGQLEYYFEHAGPDAVTPPAPLVLPPNTPPQVASQVWSQIAQQAIQNMAQPATEIDFTLVHAIVESPRLVAHYRTSGSLSAVRLVNGEFQLSATDKKSGWEHLPVTVTP